MGSYDFGFAPIAAIVIICYLVGMGVKLSPVKAKWIPTICGVVGGILGVVAYATVPTVMPAGDPFTAVALGIASGFASTGIDQAIKKAAPK